MGLGQGLDGLCHRNGQEHAVGEFFGREDGLEAQGLHAGHPDREAVAFRAACRNGERDTLDRNRLHAFPGRTRIRIKVQGPGNRPVRIAGNGSGHFIGVSHVQELRFHDGHLHGHAHDHFFPDIRVPHALVMGIDRHVVGGQFVGGLEGEGQVAGRVGNQVRLESEGGLELGTDGSVLPAVEAGFLFHHLESDSLFLNGISQGRIGRGTGHHLHVPRGAQGHRGRFLVHQVIGIRIVPVHPAANGVHGDVRDAELTQRHHRPVVRRNRIDALVIDRGQGLHARVRLEG